MKIFFELIAKFIVFVFVAYVSITAFVSFRLSTNNAKMIDNIIEMDTIQCVKIEQLIDSNNDLVEKVDFLLKHHFKCN